MRGKKEVYKSIPDDTKKTAHTRVLKLRVACWPSVPVRVTSQQLKPRGQAGTADIPVRNARSEGVSSLV
jgi:hypothetical protein